MRGLKPWLSLLAIILVVAMLLPGCNRNEITKKTTSDTTSTTTPVSPYSVTMSFPDGAPPLNQTARLQCKIRSNYPDLTGINIGLDLPEALEIVQGEPTWSGDINSNKEVMAIDIIVQAVKTGNWTINTSGNLGDNFIYIRISEETAEWRINPSFDSEPQPRVGTSEDNAIPPPIGTTQEARYSLWPIKITLSFPSLPKLNEAVVLTCNIASQIDVEDCAVKIVISPNAPVLDGSLDWKGKLKSGDTTSFSVEIMFTETGHTTVEAQASSMFSEKETSLGIGMLYLNMFTDHSDYGWPATRANVIQSVKGDNEYIVSPAADTVILIGAEDVSRQPLPPEADLQGKILPGTNSLTKYIGITVEGNWRYYTANHTIHVSFAQSSYIITSTAGVNGSISPSGSIPVTPGGSATFYIVPNSGYSISNVYVDGNGIGAVSSYTFYNVLIDHTIHAEFSQSVIYYTLTVTNDGNGFTSGGGSYQSGTTATAAAYPYAPYEFWCWDTDTGTYFSPSINIVMDGNHWAHAMFRLPW